MRTPPSTTLNNQVDVGNGSIPNTHALTAGPGPDSANGGDGDDEFDQGATTGNADAVNLGDGTDAVTYATVGRA